MNKKVKNEKVKNEKGKNEEGKNELIRGITVTCMDGWGMTKGSDGGICRCQNSKHSNALAWGREKSDRNERNFCKISRFSFDGYYKDQNLSALLDTDEQ